MRRKFSKREREALYLAADGKSDLSGLPLGADFHADHIVPFSAGGATDVSNGQALTPLENLMKSDKQGELRNWQKEFIRKWGEGTGDFLLSALPGGGKTIAALAAAKRFLAENPNGRIIVVVPSVNLQEQWQAEAFDRFKIALQATDFFGTFKNDLQGAVVTYQLIAMGGALPFKRLVMKHPTLVILDEVHHAGDESTWGAAIKEAFQLAKRRLLLSGTPFRTTGEPIPFVNYDDDGYCIPDMTYDLPTAIKDQVVRVVSFHQWRGRVECEFGDEIVTHELRSDIPLEEANEGFRLMLAPDSQLVKSLIEQSHQRLMDIRQHKPDAGGLVLCMDQGHARAIASVMREITGTYPDVVVSDKVQATSSVKTFRESTRPWVVAVRQVSEGVDIKRLQVLCYLTNYITLLFFRQAVGRIVRNQGTDFDSEAYCYIPDHPQLAAMAKSILENQLVALRQMQDEESEEAQVETKSTPDEPSLFPQFTVLGTSAEYHGVIIGDQNYKGSQANLICEVARRHNISEKAAAGAFEDFLRASGVAPPASQPATSTVSEAEVHPEKKAKVLRNKINTRVGKLAAITGESHMEINAIWTQKFRRKQHEFSMEQLQEKFEWLEKEITKAETAKRRR